MRDIATSWQLPRGSLWKTKKNAKQKSPIKNVNGLASRRNESSSTSIHHKTINQSAIMLISSEAGRTRRPHEMMSSTKKMLPCLLEPCRTLFFLPNISLCCLLIIGMKMLLRLGVDHSTRRGKVLLFWSRSEHFFALFACDARIIKAEKASEMSDLEMETMKFDKRAKSRWSKAPQPFGKRSLGTASAPNSSKRLSSSSSLSFFFPFLLCFSRGRCRRKK